MWIGLSAIVIAISLDEAERHSIGNRKRADDTGTQTGRRPRLKPFGDHAHEPENPEIHPSLFPEGN